MKGRASRGAAAWHDLTVDDAEGVRDFYQAVIGWESEGVDMGGYHDFNMNQPGSGETVAGVCHRRGCNANLPPVWLVYFTVADLGESLRECLARGGSVVDGPRGEGSGAFCVIRDPAGALCAICQE